MAASDRLMNHAELVEFYVKGYPDYHLDEMIDLFATKLGRADLKRMVASFPAPRDRPGQPPRRNRGHLRQILNACTLLEISFVGW